MGMSEAGTRGFVWSKSSGPGALPEMSFGISYELYSRITEAVVNC